MNDKLKQEFKRIKIVQKDKCLRIISSDYSDESTLLDELAKWLEQGISFIELAQGTTSDKKYYELSKKTSQLISIYDGTFVMSGSLAVSHFIEPDGVVLDFSDLDITMVRELLSENSIVGIICNSESEVKKAIKSGADYLITTPTISTSNVVIEYAKWVYENIEIPVFIEVQSKEQYNKLSLGNTTKTLLTTNCLKLFN